MSRKVTQPSPWRQPFQHEEETLSNFSSLPHDIIQAHILPRLDGASLASVGCVFTRLHSLCFTQHLWHDICSATWPSVADPRLHQIISSFPSSHRSFFSNSFPLLHHTESEFGDLASAPTKLISAVDIYYRGTAILSKIQDTVTSTRWFNRSVFRIDLLDPMDTFPTDVNNEGDDDGFMDHLGNCLTLSWILIDPTRKQAVNLSSRRPVSVRPFVLSDVEVRFGTVVGAGVKCEGVVTCFRRKGGEVHMRELRLGMVDMEGRELSGRDSLVILHSVLEKGGGEREGGRERHREFERRRRKRREISERRRWALDILGISSILLAASCLFICFGPN